MSLSLFKVLLDKDEYFAGDFIQGSILILVSKGAHEQIADTVIRVVFEGITQIQWTETSVCNDEDKIHEGKQIILRHSSKYEIPDTTTESLTDSNISTEDFRAIPLEFMLPIDLPSSLESTYGQTKYEVKVSLFTAGCKRQKTTLAFGVKGIRDLNSDREQGTLNEKISGNEVKTMCSLTCQLDIVSCSVTLPKQGFVLGEEFKILIHVQNESNHQFENVVVQIIQENTFNAPSKSLMERKVVASFREKKSSCNYVILPKEHKKWKKRIFIPETAIVSRSIVPELIECSHFIQFYMEATNFPYSIMTLRIPIIIGTKGVVIQIPKEEIQPNFSPHLLHVKKEEKKPKFKKRSSLALSSPFGILIAKNKVEDLRRKSESEIPNVFSLSCAGSNKGSPILKGRQSELPVPNITLIPPTDDELDDY